MIRPVLPGRRRLPYILAAASLLFLVYGLVDGNERSALIGGIGAAATFVGFILPRLLLPAVEPDHDDPETADDPRS